MKYFLILIISSIVISPAFAVPYVFDDELIVEEYVKGFKGSIQFAFVGNDILVLQKAGDVRLIRDGELQAEPVLHVDVATRNEQGLLGIGVLDSKVYLYFSEAESDKGQIIANRVYKYDWDGKNLINPILVHELPVNEKPQHLGGPMVTTPEGKLLLIIGDADRNGVLQNYESGKVDDSGIILHVNFDESVLKPSESSNAIEHYYAMGIRNSYGITVDPITGKIWDTENGPVYFDEVNLVEPKFNSGWELIQGPATEEQIKSLPKFYDFEYSDPEFSWERTVAPTGLTFVQSNYFEEYSDYLLVGGFHTNNIYKFKLNSERTGFIFEQPELQDLVQNEDDPNEEIIFGIGFNGVTDLKFGPDGYLYVLSVFDRTIYRVMPLPDEQRIVTVAIPDWFKINAKWWTEDKITDLDFINAVEFLLTRGFITVSTVNSEKNNDNIIPNWIKEESRNWVNQKISDYEFVKALEFLIQSGVIKVHENILRCNILPQPNIDYSRCDLSGRDLSNNNLFNANFQNAQLVGSVLSNSNLFQADFSGANMTGVEIINSNLQRSVFINSELTNSNLKKSSLIEANMEGSNLNNSILVRVDFLGAKLRHTNIQFSNLDDSQLKKVDLTNSNLTGSNLRNVKLRTTILVDAIFNGANLTKADLLNSDLSGASFVEADLSFSNLKLVKNKEAANFKDAITEGCEYCPKPK